MDELLAHVNSCLEEAARINALMKFACMITLDPSLLKLCDWNFLKPFIDSFIQVSMHEEWTSVHTFGECMHWCKMIDGWISFISVPQRVIFANHIWWMMNQPRSCYIYNASVNNKCLMMMMMTPTLMMVILTILLHNNNNNNNNNMVERNYFNFQENQVILLNNKYNINIILLTLIKQMCDYNASFLTTTTTTRISSTKTTSTSKTTTTTNRDPTRDSWQMCFYNTERSSAATIKSFLNILGRIRGASKDLFHVFFLLVGNVTMFRR